MAAELAELTNVIRGDSAGRAGIGDRGGRGDSGGRAGRGNQGHKGG